MDLKVPSLKSTHGQQLVVHLSWTIAIGSLSWIRSSLASFGSPGFSFWLVVWNIFPYGNVIIPTDELIFFREVETTNQHCFHSIIFLFMGAFLMVIGSGCSLLNGGPPPKKCFRYPYTMVNANHTLMPQCNTVSRYVHSRI